MMPPSPRPEDPERRVVAALRRAAVRARTTAAQTRTRLVVVRNGVLVAEPVTELTPDATAASSDEGHHNLVV